LSLLMNDSKIPEWASKEAKAQDHLRRPFELPWQKSKRLKDASDRKKEYDADPQASILALSQRYQAYREHLGKLDETEIHTLQESDEPAAKALQAIVNNLAAQEGLATPQVIVHTRHSPYASQRGKGLCVTTVIPDYIELNEISENYLMQVPEVFHAIAAHELGHILNHDTDAENGARQMAYPPTQKTESLADRRGAIIYGNPRKYAEQIQRSMEDFPASDPTAHSEGYPSNNGRLRHVYKWAEILEREGATNPDGTIIHDKAMEIFKRSKQLTEALEGFGPETSNNR
jgi:hypothetical protein